MKLYFFRHGIAEDQGPDGSDASRRLTDEGVKKTAHAARGLAKLINRPDALLTSPMARAAQTADILGKALKCKPQSLDVLADGSARELIETIKSRRGRSIMLVGHEPTFSEAVELLCAGRVLGKLDMKKAGCACVELDEDGATPRGTLLWLATPKMLERMA